MCSLNASLTTIKGLGEKSAQKLAHIGIYNIQDLLFHLPIRYQDKTQFSQLNNVQVASEALFQLTIEKVEQTYSRKKQLLCYLKDDQGKKLVLRFFHFNQQQKEQFVREDIIECFGELKINSQGLEIFHPEYRLISKGQKSLIERTLSPIYPLTANISQNQIKKWINIALEILQKSTLEDGFLLPNMPSTKRAIITLHHPKITDDINKIMNFNHICQQKLIIDELCAQQLSLLKIKQKRKTEKSNRFFIKNNLTSKLLEILDFKLTNSQQKCISEINCDLSNNQPMLRLLQGDVGSGKTIVSVFACLQSLENNFQVVIMAPTEILAQQHLQSFSKYLHPLNINIAFLTGSQNTKSRSEQLAKIKSGESKIVIGTHALFQESVILNKLGLVIIDEQHKFGVHQRLSLTQKAQLTPHQLIMSATPIPRSLMMSSYSDLDISIINELPPNRKKITTVVINNSRKDEVLEKIKQICAKSQQVYWVCTLIEESEALRVQSAINTLKYLQENLQELNIALVHGKMHKDEKNAIMHNFSQGKINILVATTVIEVGVNVTNASLMIIENAERLGLAQLHQLRGRVGRGIEESLCVLMYQSPLSKNAAQRLEILRQTTDGFKIAEKDLEIRGPGEVLGTKQTGIANMKIANIVRDKHLFEQVNFQTEKILQLNENQQQQFIDRWTSDEKTQYANT